MIELFRTPNYDFLKWKWHCVGLSLALLIAGGGALGRKGGPRYGIDFTGGPHARINVSAAPPAHRHPPPQKRPHRHRGAGPPKRTLGFQPAGDPARHARPLPGARR